MKVLPISSKDAYDWILHKHYLKRIPSISFSFGLFDDANNLQGIATFGTPVSSTLLRGVCGPGWKDCVLELNRVCLEEPHEPNAGSFLVSRAMRQLPKPSIIVSYADASVGHNGYLYQATNFLYTGLSTKTYDPVIKGHEGKHHGTAGCGRGMTKAQMVEKFGSDVCWVPRKQKHRYVFFVGSKREKTLLMQSLRYQIAPYPKGDNTRYDASYSANKNVNPKTCEAQSIRSSKRLRFRANQGGANE